MSGLNCLADRTLKVTHGEETRRGKLILPSEATSADAFTAIQSAVADLFETSAGGIHLKYADDEGDLCTLTEQSIADLASLAPEGTLRLTLEMRSQAADTKRIHDGGIASTITASMEVEDANDVSVNVGNSSSTAAAAGGEPSSTDDALRPKIRELLQHIPFGSRGVVAGFVQGMDPAALQGFARMAIESKSGCGSGFANADEQMQRRLEEIEAILPQLLALEPEALKALILEELQRVDVANQTNGDQPANPCANTGNAPNPLEAVMGSFLQAGKGMGKAGHMQAGSQPNASNPLEQIIAAAFVGKGMGKSGGVAPGAVPAANPLENILGALGQVLGALGQVKGAGKGHGNACSPCASPADRAAPPPSDPSRTAFEESVEDLVNMGLVSDHQVARELLTRHGDISTVVSILTEE